MSKTVFIPTDGSPIAEGAFDYAVANICREGDNVVIMMVPEYDISLAALGSDWEKVSKIVEQNTKDAETKCASYTAKLREKGLRGKAITKRGGKVGEVICATAKEEGADHIVMGTRGLGTLQRAFLGSVSNYVLNHADMPVTIVPKQK